MAEGWQELLRGVVQPWHHDQFGHMNVRWYAHFFDDAAYHVWPVFGISLQRLQREYGVHTVTARATTNFIKELSAGDLVRIEGGVTRLGSRSVAFELRMLHVDGGELHATYDMVEVFFDPTTRKATAMPEAVRQTLSAFLVEPD